MISSLPALAHLISLSAASLIVATAEAAVLAAATALCFAVFPALTAAARSRIWMGVFASAMLLPLVPALHRVSEIPAHSGACLEINLLWAVALMGVWTALSLYRGALLVRSALHLRRVGRRATPLATDATFSALLATGTAGRAVELCSSEDVDVPSIVGFVHPRILLPAALPEKMSHLDLRQIVLHEMEHLRRKDDWTNLLQKIGLVLFPVNPVLFWVERRLCVERELACDDGVLLSTGAAKAYATCLTNLAEDSLLRRSLTLALGAWQRQSELTRRVLRILRMPQQQHAASRRSTFSAAAVTAVVLCSAFALARAPQFIAFSPEAASQTASALAPSREITNHYPATGAPHATLVDAVMPDRTRPPLALLKRPASARTMSSAGEARFRHSQPRMVLTRWREIRSTRRMTLAMYQDPQVTYAAIPVRDGWLLVQL